MNVINELNINNSDIVVCECVSKNKKTYFALCIKYNEKYLFLNYLNSAIVRDMFKK